MDEVQIYTVPMVLFQMAKKYLSPKIPPLLFLVNPESKISLLNLVALIIKMGKPAFLTIKNLTEAPFLTK